MWSLAHLARRQHLQDAVQQRLLCLPPKNTTMCRLEDLGREVTVSPLPSLAEADAAQASTSFSILYTQLSRSKALARK